MIKVLKNHIHWCTSATVLIISISLFEEMKNVVKYKNTINCIRYGYKNDNNWFCNKTAAQKKFK